MPPTTLCTVSRDFAVFGLDPGLLSSCLGSSVFVSVFPFFRRRLRSLTLPHFFSAPFSFPFPVPPFISLDFPFLLYWPIFPLCIASALLFASARHPSFFFSSAFSPVPPLSRAPTVHPFSATSILRWHAFVFFAAAPPARLSAFSIAVQRHPERRIASLHAFRLCCSACTGSLPSHAHGPTNSKRPAKHKQTTNNNKPNKNNNKASLRALSPFCCRHACCLHVCFSKPIRLHF